MRPSCLSDNRPVSVSERSRLDYDRAPLRARAAHDRADEKYWDCSDLGANREGDKAPYVMVIQHAERHAAGEPGRALRYGVVKAFIGLLTPSPLPLESIDSTV